MNAVKQENREAYDGTERKELEQEACVAVQLPNEIEPTLVRMSTVESKRLRWLWKWC